jgi:hypothetical protein
MNDRPHALSDFFTAVSPHVSAEIRKGIESIQDVLALFPGHSPGEVFTSIQKMQAAALSSVAAMVERAKKVILAPTDDADSPEAFLKDAGKLSAGDLQALLHGLGLAVIRKTKAACALELKLWIESKGTYAPRSEADRKRERAQELAGDLPQKMGQMTGALADEIIRRADAAAKDKELGSDGFRIFASLLLGMPMTGTKSRLLKEIKSFVDRLATSAAQTSGI